MKGGQLRERRKFSKSVLTSPARAWANRGDVSPVKFDDGELKGHIPHDLFHGHDAARACNGEVQAVVEHLRQRLARFGRKRCVVAEQRAVEIGYVQVFHIGWFIKTGCDRSNRWRSLCKLPV